MPYTEEVDSSFSCCLGIYLLNNSDNKELEFLGKTNLYIP